MKNFRKGHPADMTYPCNMGRLEGIDTRLVNPCNGKIHSFEEPYREGSAEWDRQTNALVRLSMDVERGKWPGWYLESCGVDPVLSPILEMVGLSMDDPQGCADSVRMDQPQELWMAIIRYISGPNHYVPLKGENKMAGIPFLERNVYAAETFQVALSKAMREGFEAKYFFGVERPEEHFESANFAHYPEGCPNHPSYPAGHAIVGGVANRVSNALFELEGTDEQRDIESATKQFAHFRDFARVHTEQDSKAGWEFGNAA